MAPHRDEEGTLLPLCLPTTRGAAFWGRAPHLALFIQYDNSGMVSQGQTSYTLRMLQVIIRQCYSLMTAVLSLSHRLIMASEILLLLALTLMSAFLRRDMDFIALTKEENNGFHPALHLCSDSSSPSPIALFCPKSVLLLVCPAYSKHLHQQHRQGNCCVTRSSVNGLSSYNSHGSSSVSAYTQTSFCRGGKGKGQGL